MPCPPPCPPRPTAGPSPAPQFRLFRMSGSELNRCGLFSRRLVPGKAIRPFLIRVPAAAANGSRRGRNDKSNRQTQTRRGTGLEAAQWPRGSSAINRLSHEPGRTDRARLTSGLPFSRAVELSTLHAVLASGRDRLLRSAQRLAESGLDAGPRGRSESRLCSRPLGPAAGPTQRPQCPEARPMCVAGVQAEGGGCWALHG